MNIIDAEKAWNILIERKADRPDNRAAFIGALLATKCGLSSHVAEAYAAELIRLAGIIHREAEAACSVERTPTQIARGERAETRFAAIAEALGFEARTGGDPRGACAYLIDPDNRKGDGWGEGWAIYA